MTPLASKKEVKKRKKHWKLSVKVMILRLLDQQGFVQFEILYLTLSFFFAEVLTKKCIYRTLGTFVSSMLGMLF